VSSIPSRIYSREDGREEGLFLKPENLETQNLSKTTTEREEFEWSEKGGREKKDRASAASMPKGSRKKGGGADRGIVMASGGLYVFRGFRGQGGPFVIWWEK